jgi:hypothetical protein
MVLFQREVNCTNNYVWETMKCIGASLEVKDDDSDNDLLYIPLAIPPNLFFRIRSSYGRRCSCILMDYHLKICYQVLYPPSRLFCPLRVTLKSMEKDQNK